MDPGGAGASAGVMKSRRTTHIEPQMPGKQWDGFYEVGQVRQGRGQLNPRADRAHRSANVDSGITVNMWGKWCCRLAANAGSEGCVQM